MKVLDKIAMVIFSILFIVITIGILLLSFNIIRLDVVGSVISAAFSHETAHNVIVAISIVVFILAFKCLFFDADSMEKSGAPIKMQGENGELVISRDTIENIANSAARSFAGTKETTSRVRVTKGNEVKVNVFMYILPDANITTLTKNVQVKVKETIKKVTDIEVTAVNVKIKDIYVKNDTPIE